MVYDLPRLVVVIFVELVKCFVEQKDRISDEVAIIWLSVPRSRALGWCLVHSLPNQAEQKRNPHFGIFKGS